MSQVAGGLKRSAMWRVLAVYVGASWVVLQVVDVVKQNMGLPDWVFPFALVLLLIGLPVMLVTAILQAGPSKGAVATAGADSGATAPGDATERTGELSSRRLFTWRNALLGGAGAFVMLALVTGGFMFMRTRGIGPVGSLVAKGVLEERGKVILADFQAADPEIARAATEALRVDLAQSDIVTLVEPDSIDDALRRMGRSTGEPLDEETARQIGMRDGVPAVIAGELSSVGGGFALSARLVASDDGEVLASARASARDSSGVLDAIDEVSSRLREQIGESYSSVRESPPLAHVTTSSLEALRKYTQAQDARFREGNLDAAIGLLEEAIAIDTAFALAYRDLATILSNQRRGWDRQVRALEAAYRHRDRLTERERYLVEASYSQDVLDDRTRTIQAYEAMLRLDPRDAQALNNIGFNYWQQGDFARAGEYYRRAREADPGEALYAANVAAAWANTGELDRADSAYAVLEEMSESPQFVPWRAGFEIERGNEEEARTIFLGLIEDYPNQTGLVTGVRWALGNLELLHGRLSTARDYFPETTSLSDPADDAERTLRSGLRLAAFLLVTAQDTAAALAELDRVLAGSAMEDLPPLDRPAGFAASIAAWAGDPGRARRLLAERDADLSSRQADIEHKYEHVVQSWIALAEGDHDRALAELRQQPRTGCARCLPLDFARLFETTGQADSAIARYEQFFATPSNFDLWFTALFDAAAHESLARLYDERGDLENAALHYAQFVEMWEDADPMLQPRVEAARARLQEIVRERG
ncbi:MAG: tetratricopeptide repeat protein [Candidatus Palauibacterales bacterium]|nr:tetratricopeptide repeat protein [Candidatus Palauibacterales bacterium]